MKRFYLFLLTLCLVSIYSLPAAADDWQFVESDGIHYSLKGRNKVYVINSFHVFPSHQSEVIDETNYSWLSGDVVIPKSVYVSDPWHAIYSHQNIVGIEDCAFKNMTAPVRILLPSTIKEIGYEAFLKATGLERIILNEGLTDMGQYAFCDCSNLESLKIPSTLEYIPRYAFCNCTSMRNITLPAVKRIDKGAFQGCTSLQFVRGGSTDYIWAQEIGPQAFWGCTDLRYICFGDMLETIGMYAFEGCKRLKAIELPANLKTINNGAFEDTGLETVTNYSLTPQNINGSVFMGLDLSKCILFVPKGCREKYQNAEVWKRFGVIEELSEMPVIAGTRKIGNLYYDLHEDMTATVLKHDNNSNLSGALEIPSSVSLEVNGFTYTYTVNRIEERAFSQATGLTSIELPVTLDSIPDLAFFGCSGITKVTFPSSLSKIGACAFERCSSLKNLTLPDNLEEIGSSAFYGCSSLTSITIPAGVEVLPERCFMDCSQLSKVWLREGLKEINDQAFSYCSALTTITLPESLEEIGEEAFFKTSALASIRCLGTTPPLASYYSFLPKSIYSTCILYVPVGCKKVYKEKGGWQNFSDIREQGVNMKVKYGDLYYQLKEDFTAMVTCETYENNYEGNYSYLVGEVTIEDKVIYEGREYKVNAVDASAFQNAINLTKVNLPKMMDGIYAHAFSHTNLFEINIPATLTHLSNTAFQETPIFTTNQDAVGAVYYDKCLLYFPEDYMGPYNVKEGTRLIASYVFSQTQRLTELYLPESMQCICTGAIDHLPLLRVLSLPSSITYIGEGFCTAYCSSLSEIYCYSERPYLFTSDNYFQYWTQEQLAQIKLYVPAGSKSAYSQADKWKDLSIVEMEAIYTVTFVDYDGTVLNVQRVQKGKDAKWPEDPKRKGYTFIGWDKDLTNVQSDLTVTAQYEIKTYIVLFVDGYTDGEIDTQYVTYGGSATEPEAPKHDGYVFIGWDKEFDVIMENTIVTALYMEGDGLVTTVYDGVQRTLTYYYDKELQQRPGITEIYDPVGNPDAVRFTGYYDKIVKAVIDPSMKEAPLTSTYGMFYGGTNTDPFKIQTLYNMTEIEGLENLNTSSVTNMESMFFSCSALTMLDLSSFNTSNVTTMNGMFLGCNKLEIVDVSSFDISNVTDMYMMFSGCSKLRTICCFKDWSSSTAKSDYMFSVCNSLVGGQGTVFNSSVIDKTYARPDGGTGAPGYFTSDTMTGINEIDNRQQSTDNGPIYNLAGQRLQKLQKGINIIGGRKVLVK